MKNVLKIFTSDIKSLFNNKIALVIVFGLLVLPSLYAWFNIYASWDPYGNTKDIKVVVCNKDLGWKLEDEEINIGKDVAESLKENHSLCWTFVDNTDEAIDLATKGDVYASIIIPKDFSEKMSTIISDKPIKPTLEYYVNEKINAISPKITDKGASAIQNKISTAFVESVTKQIFSQLKDVGIETSDIRPIFNIYKKNMDYIIKNLPIIMMRLNNTSELIDDGAELTSLSTEDVDLINNVLNDLVSFTHDFRKDVDILNYNTDDISRNLVETLNLTKVSLEDLDDNTMKLKEKIILEKPDIVYKLDDCSSDLKKTIKNIRSIEKSLEEFDEDISPEIEDLIKTTDSQLIEVEKLLDKLAYDNLNNNAVFKTTESIRSMTSKIRYNLLKLNNKIENNLRTKNNDYYYINDISNNLSNLLAELNGKTQTTETADNICDNILVTIKNFKSEIVDNKSVILRDLELIEKNVENLKANRSFKKSLIELNLNNVALKEYLEGCNKLITKLEEASDTIDIALYSLNTIDNICNMIDRDLHKYINDVQYYSKQLARNIDKIRKNLNSISELSINETNYLMPIIKEVTDISLSRLDDVANSLNDISDEIENTDNIETSLDNMHNLNLNMISNIDNLIIKINTDLTSTVKRYLSSTSEFSSDINRLLMSITSKTTLIKDFLDKLSYNGQVTAYDISKLSKELPELQKDLILINNKVNKFSENFNLDKFVNKVQSNKSLIADFMAYPVDLSTHTLYATKNYGCSMTPFYTTLSLWVGVLILGSLLTTESKNTDFEPTPLQTHLGKFMLFAILAVIQGLIVALGDIFLLQVTACEPILFINLSMFLSLVFCTIIYTLISLFGNVGKAMGVILLVLQVAGSGGTFPIQMTPPFFQMLYSWLPFTYGIGALREAVSGVLYTSLKTDIITLIIYLIVFLIIGILLISKTYKYLKAISHKLEESGISE